MTKAMGFLNMLKNRLSREDIYNKPDYWNAKAEELEGAAKSLWPNNNLNELYEKEQFVFYDKFLGNITDLKAVDVGCGIGNVSRFIAKRGANVTGFDFSEKVIEIAKRMSGGIPNLSFKVESVFNFCEANQYDLVTCRACLTVACKNEDDLVVALKNIANSIKPGGKCIIIEPIHSGFLHRVLNISLEDFVNVMNQVGFNVKYTEQLHFVPMRLLLCYINWPMFITKPLYHLGQWIMHKLGWRWGDYKAIYAERN